MCIKVGYKNDIKMCSKVVQKLNKYNKNKYYFGLLLVVMAQNKANGSGKQLTEDN